MKIELEENYVIIFSILKGSKFKKKSIFFIKYLKQKE